MTDLIKNNYQRVAEFIMNLHHECQCDCPTEDMHYEYMYSVLEEQKYYLTEYDLMNFGAEWLNQTLA